MLKHFYRAMLVGMSLLSLQPVFAADISIHEVYQAANSGHLREAQAMMDQVLSEHPNSAKAHYVDAELHARAGQLDAARRELATAEQLEPGLPFAKTESVQALQSQLNGSATAPYAASRGSSIPWGLLFVGGLLILSVMLFVRSLRQRAAIANTQGSAFGDVVPPNYGPGYGQGGGMGSSILGGLATGAAVGAGMVAGEALASRLMDGGHGENYQASPEHFSNDINNDLGGNDFGVGDSSSWDSSFGGDLGGGDWS